MKGVAGGGVPRILSWGLDGDPRRQRVARPTVALARALDVVAEGIETAAQSAMCLDLGGTTGQGYLIARPCPQTPSATSSSAEHSAHVLMWVEFGGG